MIYDENTPDQFPTNLFQCQAEICVLAKTRELAAVEWCVCLWWWW